LFAGQSFGTPGGRVLPVVVVVGAGAVTTVVGVGIGVVVATDTTVVVGATGVAGTRMVVVGAALVEAGDDPPDTPDAGPDAARLVLELLGSPPGTGAGVTEVAGCPGSGTIVVVPLTTTTTSSISWSSVTTTGAAMAGFDAASCKP
jgi:hypothetical protein